MAGILSGLSTFGHHVGVGSSYAAFLAPLGHIAARLHAIAPRPRPRTVRGTDGARLRARRAQDGRGRSHPRRPAAAADTAGELPGGHGDHAHPVGPAGVLAPPRGGLPPRPAVIAPFVTRPNETVLDRERLGLAPVEAAAKGVYRLRAPRRGKGDVTIVLQESAVTYAFLEQALPMLERDGIDPCVYYVASAELFSMLPADEQARIFPEARAQEAMGITGFTLPTLYRWCARTWAAHTRSTRSATATSSAAGRGRWSSPRPASTA